ncbi:hypothetical protein OG203_17305 [Nocardia sp. NBC_01499]|uniref:hypothetical protein n=1 Tax=Nocardia sp. NBC_01499 TaxID=2903597 RepID=UPI0038662965
MGSTLITAPAAAASGDSITVLYNPDGTVSHQLEMATTPHPDNSAEVTAWVDNGEPEHSSFTADQLRTAAAQQPAVAKEIGLGPVS